MRNFAAESLGLVQGSIVDPFRYCRLVCPIFQVRRRCSCTVPIVRTYIVLEPLDIHVTALGFLHRALFLFWSFIVAIDGAYFGTSFPHLFLQQFKQCVPKKFTDRYTPKIFGFKLHSNRLLEESASCKAKPDVQLVGPPSRDNALPADP